MCRPKAPTPGLYAVRPAHDGELGALRAEAAVVLGTHVAAIAETVGELALLAPERGEQVVVAVYHDETVTRHLVEQLGLGPEHAAAVAEGLEVGAGL